MKDVKSVASIEIKEFGIHVNPYLTYAQIQVISDNVKKLTSWANRQQCIDMLVLHYVTDIGSDKLNEIDHDYWLNTGIIDEVKRHVINIDKIEAAIKYEESPIRLLVSMSNEMPEFNEKLNKALEMAKNANGDK